MLEFLAGLVTGGFLGVLLLGLCRAAAREGSSALPPLSEADRCRLPREWTDANLRGDDEARRRVEDEILGRPAQKEPLQVRTHPPQHRSASDAESNKERKAV
jgi:hypothetical protein